jgi:hypothetical protein
MAEVASVEEDERELTTVEAAAEINCTSSGGPSGISSHDDDFLGLLSRLQLRDVRAVRAGCPTRSIPVPLVHGAEQVGTRSLDPEVPVLRRVDFQSFALRAIGIRHRVLRRHRRHGGDEQRADKAADKGGQG